MSGRSSRSRRWSGCRRCGREPGEGAIETEVTYVDSFGNLRLAGGADELAAAFGSLEATRQVRVLVGEVDIGPAFLVPSFGHVEEGAAVLYVDSTGDLALAVNQGDLAARTGAMTGTLYVDSTGDLALAVNQGDLAARTGATSGTRVAFIRR